MEQIPLLRPPQDHVAIMSTDEPWIDLIIEGKKTIESRWYVNRIAPWDRIYKGDTIYFKESGGLVWAFAKVSEVHQFSNLEEIMFDSIVERFADDICLVNRDYTEYYKKKNFCILIELENPQELEEPFEIDKTGFGNAAAWMVVGDIEQVKRDDGEGEE